jgi:hypothetical protein
VIEGRQTKANRNPLRAGGLVRSVARRSRSDWPLVLAAWLLLACATCLIASAVAYSESVTLGGFHKVIDASSPATSAVRIYTSVTAGDLPAADAVIEPAIESTLGAALGSIDVISTTDGLSLAGVDASDQTHQILVGSYGGIESHARLTAGAWPTDQPAGDRSDDPCSNQTTASGRPIEAALSEPAAKALGLGLGERVALTSKLDPSKQVDICVSAIFAPAEADRYWLASSLELRGVQITGSTATRGPFVVTPAGLGALAGANNITVEWRWLPDIGAIAPTDADPLRAAIAGLKDRVQAAYAGGYVWMDTGLPDTLAAATKSLLVAQSSSLLLFAQFVVLAVYAILLVGGMLVERRRPEAALLRSRGASWPHLALLSFGEALLLAIPAVAVAPLVAQGVVRLMAVFGPLAGENVVEPVGTDTVTVAAAVLAGIGCVAVLTIPSLPSLGSLSGVRAALSRQLGRTLAQRLGLDVVLVILAAVALWQLRSYGSPLTTTVRGDLGIDPLLVAAPAIGLLAGALAATRLVPRLGELGERALERATGLATTFLARQMGRRPLRYTRIALLLMLAAAMGTFAAAFAATWNDSQAEQAAYQSGGDIRVVLADRPAVPAWGVRSLYAAVPGVVSVASVGRTKFDVGRDLSGGQLLTIEPSALSTTSTTVRGTEELGSEVASLGGAADDGSVELPGSPARIRLSLRLDLQFEGIAVGDLPPDEGETVAELAITAVVANSGGAYRIDGGSASAPTGAGPVDATATIPLTAGADGTAASFTYPIRLIGLEMAVSGHSLGNLMGAVEITGLAVQDGAASAAWTPVPGLPAPAWGWSELQYGQVAAYISPSGRPGLISLGSHPNQAPAPVIGMDAANSSVLRYIAMGSATPTPGIANQQLLDDTGARVGDTILISRGGYESRVRIVATASLFPTLDPARPFLVVDTGRLVRSDYEDNELLTVARELWLEVAPGREGAVSAQLGAGPYSVSSMFDRLDIERSGRADPIALGVIGALFLGSLAALLLAAIGFLVNAAFTAGERNGELAVLRALGERPRTLVRMLAMEQLLLMIYGLAGGVVLGLVLGWLAIPFAWLTPAGTVPVPAPDVVVPWAQLAMVALPVAAALLVGATLLIRSAMGGPAAAALRRQDVAP